MDGGALRVTLRLMSTLTASGICTLINMQWSLKCGNENEGDAECGVIEPWMQETLVGLCAKLGLSPDPFGNLKVPTSTEERFERELSEEEELFGSHHTGCLALPRGSSSQLPGRLCGSAAGPRRPEDPLSSIQITAAVQSGAS
ncbi:hypothetical protein COCOBI_13-1210 [Coccomyxa sp. Obi]|nr:hypothetical protein COCOBI_13-1210 [Coccomyxa sp. Obi]